MTGQKPIRFRLIDKDGKAYAPFRTKPGINLRDVTRQAFPGQEQRDENGSDGWDLRIAGVDKETDMRSYICWFSAPILALLLTPFVVELILWSVKP